MKIKMKKKMGKKIYIYIDIYIKYKKKGDGVSSLLGESFLPKRNQNEKKNKKRNEKKTKKKCVVLESRLS